MRLANDANCFALSEAIDGAAAGYDLVFGAILGTGVGGGGVAGGRVLTGANAVAGEWGHNPLPAMTPEEWPRPECYCGRRGCIKTFLSGHGLAADHAPAAGQTLAAEEIAAQAVVLGGGLSNLSWLYEAVPARWAHYVFSDRVDTRLLPPRHAYSSGVRGAAWLWRPGECETALSESYGGATRG